MTQASSPHLIYFADPMCSWCWGFSPVIRAISEVFGEALPIRLVLGGLRPGHQTPMTEAAKLQLREHWGHVAEASGQPIDYGFFDRIGFVYDSDPAAQAVVLVREQDPQLALPFLARVQAAFYAHNRDVTSREVLVELVAEAGLDRDWAAARLGEPQLRETTWTDYALSQRAGVTGFPTLIAGPNADGAYRLITAGFRPAEEIFAGLAQWLDAAPR